MTKEKAKNTMQNFSAKRRNRFLLVAMIAGFSSALYVGLVVRGDNEAAFGTGPHLEDGFDSVALQKSDSGIDIAAGFDATIFAQNIGPVRHMAMGPDGWLYGALYRPKQTDAGMMGAVALKDMDGDGRADQIHYFAEGLEGTGLHIDGNWLYYGADEAIWRFAVRKEAPLPLAPAELVVGGFPSQQAHSAKAMAFDQKGHFYVNVGVPSNACMLQTRTKGSKGQDPCPELEWHGGIYRFDAHQLGQDFKKDGVRYSTGHRNINALDWNKQADALFVVQHGRDQLHQFFPEFYDAEKSAALPAEEFHRLEQGDDLGWPYSYYDPYEGARMLNPEYGGDGKKVAERGKLPLRAFPGHWAPNDLLFLERGEALQSWPDFWQRGAYISFHGSWNRAPEPQQGYRLVYLPFNDKGMPEGPAVNFANGFAGDGVITSPSQAKHRPMGLASGRDGALYVSSMTSGGQIWLIRPASEKGLKGRSRSADGDGQAQKDPRADLISSPISPSDLPPVAASSSGAVPSGAVPSGEALYSMHCASCHQADASGVPFLQPALIASPKANGSIGPVIAMILKGSRAVTIKSDYDNEMPAFAELTNEEIAALASYVRTHFSNHGGPVSSADVARLR